MKFVRPTLLVLVLLIPALVYMAVFTQQGTRSLISAVQRLAPLEIEYDGGSLGGRLVLSRLLFETDELRVELLGIVAELAPACLWRAAVCFEQLQIGRLDIAILPGSATQQGLTDANEDTPLFEFPLPTQADAFELMGLRVHWQGGEWQQGAMRAQVNVHRSRIELHNAVIERPQLILQDPGAVDDGDSAAAELPAIELPLDLSITNLQLHKPSWDVNGELFELDKIVLTGRWQRSDLRLDVLQVESAEVGDLSLRGQVTFTGDWPIVADVDIGLAESLQFSGLFGDTVTATLRNTVAALDVQLHYPGTVDLAVEGRVNALDSALPFSATLTATSAGRLAIADIEGVPTRLQDLELEFPLVLSVDGSLDSQRFQFHGGARGWGYGSLRLAASGQHQHETLTLADLSIQDTAGNNALRGSGEIFLSPGYPWAVSLHSSGLDLPASSESLHGRVDGAVQLAGTLQEDHWELRIAEVAVQGQINDMPAHITGFAGVNSKLQLLHSTLQAQVNGADLSLHSPGDAPGPGTLQLTVADIGRWQAGSAGQLHLNAEVSADRERVQLAGRMQQIEWSGLGIEEAAIAGNYDAGADHALHLDINFSDVGIGGVTLSTVQLRARGDRQKRSIALASRGDIQGELQVQGAMQEQRWQGLLAPTRLQTPMGEWVLADGVALTAPAAMNQVSVAAQCWRHQYAQLCAGDWLLGAQGGGSVQLQSDLQIIAGLLPPDAAITGDLQMQLDARWAPDSPVRATGSAHTDAVTLTRHFGEGQSATFGWDEADAVINLTGAGLNLDIGVQRERQKIVGLQLLIPADRSDALAGEVHVNQLQLDALAPFVPSLATLAGEFNAQLRLGGTVDTPQAFGEISLVDGKLIADGNPTALDQLNVSLDVQGDWASVRGDGLLGGGELQFVGEINTDPEFKVDLTLEGTDQLVLYPPSTELTISQALMLTLKKDLLILTGQITVQDGVLEIEELPPDSVALSPYVFEVDTDGKALREDLPFDVRMNLQIHIADRFTVTGNTVQTRLGGDLRVQQRPGGAPRVFGNLNLIGGEFRAYQSRLQIKRGTLSFTGPPDNPTLDVRAERHISSSDVTVGVQVQGPLQNDLQLAIYSNPAMTQTNAMSYLVRGRGMDAGAGLDGTSAALSLASGVANRSDLVTELNRIPGVSDVEFGAQGSEADTAATISGYLGERIYLSYGVGLYDPVNVLTARFYLRSRLWLEVVSSFENSLDLYYSFDID